MRVWISRIEHLHDLDSVFLFFFLSVICPFCAQRNSRISHNDSEEEKNVKIPSIYDGWCLYSLIKSTINIKYRQTSGYESMFQRGHARIASVHTKDMENIIMNEHLAISPSVLYSSGIFDKLSWKESTKLLIRYKFVRFFQQDPIRGLVFLENMINDHVDGGWWR